MSEVKKLNFVKKLVNDTRIDLVIGIDYVDSHERKLQTEFFKDLHIEHKKSFNGLRDQGHRGASAFLERFNSLIDAIKVDKINHTPVLVYKIDEDNFWLWDGYHRLSILYYYKLDGNFKILNVNRRVANRGIAWFHPTNIGFFKERNLSEFYLKYIMLRFLESYQEEYRCLVLFPRRQKELPDEIYSTIKDDILYDLEINPCDNFSKNFIQLLYFNEAWCKRSGGIRKLNKCFFTHGGKRKVDFSLRIFFIKKYSNDKLVDLKQKIRDYYMVGKDSIHTPDTQKECNVISHLLNENTVKYFEKTPTLYNNFENFKKCFNELISFCKQNEIDARRICVTSSAVLSVYCIRDCKDIDLLIDREYVDIFKKSTFDAHNKYADDGHYSLSSDEIIYNSENHFYYMGIKFCALNIIYNYKLYRVENNLFGKKSIMKDKSDIDKIEKLGI